MSLKWSNVQTYSRIRRIYIQNNIRYAFDNLLMANWYTKSYHSTLFRRIEFGMFFLVLSYN